ncbi:uncharacterized protein CLUP02_08340 [Colletotrichum lupini]|uniref:Uncharacterized protein n=1 Tax=Colletotrichum lupini TaxID=145971 RepID=A0A9Q8WHJ1_9PEZI|nr:uncharacterized protein CLUP02_08340 [Colletotrichum lupini]UQC82850.1 hypothetical protein CLUP02_08340 [Colletotrichum lupini]
MAHDKLSVWRRMNALQTPWSPPASIFAMKGLPKLGGVDDRGGHGATTRFAVASLFVYNLAGAPLSPILSTWNFISSSLCQTN